MVTIKHRRRLLDPAANRGTSMLEILITIVILTFGMLGLAALQARAHTAELESYQRGQALILLEDMLSRMEANRTAAAVLIGGAAYPYVTSTALGTGATDATTCTTLTTRAAIDLCEWSKAIKGSSEAKTVGGTTTKQGAMIDGRGCVALVSGTTFMVSVVWQGMNPTAVPATSCGSTQYDSESTRRAVTAVYNVTNLAAP